jgi:HTH-type transcriptional regulator/antitoxin HigA
LRNNIKFLRNETNDYRKDYLAGLERLEVIFDARAGSKESEELYLLVDQIELYENEHYPLEFLDN